MLTVLFREAKHLTNRESCKQLQQSGGVVGGKETTISIGDDLENLSERITDKFLTTSRGTFVSLDWPFREEIYAYHFFEMSESELKALDDFERRILRSLEKYPDDKKRISTEAINRMKMNIDKDFLPIGNSKEPVYILSLCLRKTSLI